MRIDSYSHYIENYFGELRLVVTAYNKRLDQYFDFFRVYESGKKNVEIFTCHVMAVIQSPIPELTPVLITANVQTITT